MALPSFTFFIKHTQSLNVQVMLRASHLRKLRQQFLPWTLPWNFQALAEASERKEVGFFSFLVPVFSFNDL